MPLFKCAKCGCVENTALGHYWIQSMVDNYDWTGLEEYKGTALCSECAPTHFANGEPTGRGKWHGKFPKEPYDPAKHG